MNGSRKFAPPTAWLLAIAIILPIPLPLFAPAMIAEPDQTGANEQRYRHDLTEFLIERRGENSRPRGVMLAMSGGSCATVGPLRLADNGVDMYVAFYNDANLSNFLGLVDVLSDGSPDFVVIQDAILVFSQRSGWVRETYLRARLHWRGQLRGLANALGVPDASEKGDGPWRCRGWPMKQSTWASHVERSMVRISTYSEPRHVEAVSFVNTFSSAGIPVMIVGAPVNTYTIEYTSRMHESAGELLHTDPPNSALSFHRPTTLMPDELFPDPFHVSPDSNQPYRDWLNQEVLKVLREHSDQ